MSSSSSSSDDEEENQRLKESVSGFNIESEQQKKKEKKPSKKSLRQSENDEIRESVLNTTPEFRKFIAKKLDSYFEEIIKDKSVANSESSEKKEECNGSDGIRLLWNSCIILADVEPDSAQNSPSTVKPKKKKKYVSSSSSDDEEEMERLRSAAVTSDFVTGIPTNIKEEKNDLADSKKSRKKKKSKVVEVD